MKITKNFSLEEFTNSATAKKNKIDNTPNNEAINNIIRLATNILQPIRDKLGEPIKITSGFRCKVLNDKVGGVKTSQHLTGDAADITLGSKQGNKELMHMIIDMAEKKEITFGQLIDEANCTWLHISNPRAGKKTNQFLTNK